MWVTRISISWLNNHKQRESINGSMSDEQKVPSGTPNGPVPCSELFTLQEESKLIKSAEDVQVIEAINALEKKIKINMLIPGTKTDAQGITGLAVALMKRIWRLKVTKNSETTKNANLGCISRRSVCKTREMIAPQYSVLIKL